MRSIMASHGLEQLEHLLGHQLCALQQNVFATVCLGLGSGNRSNFPHARDDLTEVQVGLLLFSREFRCLGVVNSEGRVELCDAKGEGITRVSFGRCKKAPGGLDFRGPVGDVITDDGLPLHWSFGHQSLSFRAT
ncbi:MAG: hypothetical protein ACXWWG_00490 [Nitrospira sp.]